MLILIAGLIIFLGIHSLRVVSPAGRERLFDRLGESRFKGAYSILSVVGLVLLVYGYGQARADTTLWWVPPTGLKHLTFILVPISFILVASAYLPRGRIKAAVKHPMVLGVAVWALGHLLVNGTGADVVLFGAFLVWAVADYLSSLGRADGIQTSAKAATAPTLSLKGDVLAVVIGIVLTAGFVGGLHLWLIGVSPLG